MPKDPTKNVDRYKVRGGDINEFEYEQKQEAFAEQKNKAATNLIPGTPPEEKAQRFPAAVASKATKTTTKKAATKATKKAAVAARGASAKKLAARKTAKKR
jgi:hypothetical protein